MLLGYARWQQASERAVEHAAWTYERRAEGTSTTSPAGTGAGGFPDASAAALGECFDRQAAAAAVAAACFSCAQSSRRQHAVGELRLRQRICIAAIAPQCSLERG